MTPATKLSVPKDSRQQLSHLSDRLAATKQTLDIKTRAAAIVAQHKTRKRKWDTAHIESFLLHFEKGGTLDAASVRFALSPASILVYLRKLRSKGHLS